MIDLKAYINEKRLVDRFISLVKIDSLSGEEEEISRHLAAELEKMGCSVIREECGNIVAHFPASGKTGTVLFCAHMDTVGDQYGIQPIIEDGIIHTDGSTILGGDDKAGIAVIFEMMEILLEHPEIDHPELEIVLTISEEIGLVGSKKLDKNLLHADWGVILDIGGPIGTVSVSGPTCRLATYTFHGKAAHAATTPSKGINAIKAAAIGIANCPIGNVEEDAVIGIGTIHGGIATNVVPDEVVVETMMRSSDIKKVQHWSEVMDKAMQEGCDAVGATVSVTTQETYPLYHLTMEDSIPLQKIAAACEQCGIPLATKKSLGGTDANILNAAGIPCIPSASGDNGAHMKTEYVVIADLFSCVELHLTAALL